MKDWPSEEQIKAQLRELTNETRKLRNDLYQLIRPSKTLGPRAFMQDRSARPAQPPPADDPPGTPENDEET